MQPAPIQRPQEQPPLNKLIQPKDFLLGQFMRISGFRMILHLSIMTIFLIHSFIHLSAFRDDIKKYPKETDFTKYNLRPEDSDHPFSYFLMLSCFYSIAEEIIGIFEFLFYVLKKKKKLHLYNYIMTALKIFSYLGILFMINSKDYIYPVCILPPLFRLFIYAPSKEIVTEKKNDTWITLPSYFEALFQAYFALKILGSENEYMLTALIFSPFCLFLSCFPLWNILFDESYFYDIFGNLFVHLL